MLFIVKLLKLSTHVNNAQLHTLCIKLCQGKRLHEDISKLVFWSEQNANILRHLNISSKVTMNFNVFSSLIKDCITSNISRSLIIIMHWYWLLKCTQDHSKVYESTLSYSVHHRKTEAYYNLRARLQRFLHDFMFLFINTLCFYLLFGHKAHSDLLFSLSSLFIFRHFNKWRSTLVDAK